MLSIGTEKNRCPEIYRFSSRSKQNCCNWSHARKNLGLTDSKKFGVSRNFGAKKKICWAFNDWFLWLRWKMEFAAFQPSRAWMVVTKEQMTSDSKALLRVQVLNTFQLPLGEYVGWASLIPKSIRIVIRSYEAVSGFTNDNIQSN